MNYIETEVDGCYIIEPSVFLDDRGYFYVSYSQNEFEKHFLKDKQFVQDNISYSKGKVVRGMHLQKGKFGQAKLVSILQGKVQDVVVDMRKNSTTFGNVVHLELSAENKRQIYIPRGCAHGFLTLSDEVLFSYKCDNYYNKESEVGLSIFDSKLENIWIETLDDAIVSEKDKQTPFWNQIDFDLIL